MSDGALCFRRSMMRSRNWTLWTRTRTKTRRWSCSCCEITWRCGRRTRRATATSPPRVATTNPSPWSPQHTHLFSLVFYKKTSNIRERRAIRLSLSPMRAVACIKMLKKSFAADLHVPSKIKCYVSSLTVLYFCIYTGLQISSWPDEYKYI